MARISDVGCNAGLDVYLTAYIEQWKVMSHTRPKAVVNRLLFAGIANLLSWITAEFDDNSIICTASLFMSPAAG